MSILNKPTNKNDIYLSIGITFYEIFALEILYGGEFLL
jgi:hypothetical protein